MSGAPPAIFDRPARRLRRDRIGGAAALTFERHVADLIEERIAAVTRPFARALVINTGLGVLAERLAERGMAVTATEAGTRLAAKQHAIWCDEDALTVTLAAFDLVIAAAGFDTVDDLPGALLLARRSLAPDGMFLGVIAGAPGLPVLRRAVTMADGDRAVARIHPQIDVRAAGDLLVRAGFTLAVADAETVQLGYREVGALIGDLRAIGGTNVLVQRHGVDRRWRAGLADAFADQAGADGRVVETATLLVLTGWAAAAATAASSGRSAGGIGSPSKSAVSHQRSASA